MNTPQNIPEEADEISQKQRWRHVTAVAHAVIGVVLRLRNQVIEIFESVRLRRNDFVGNREYRQ
jgi:hypothetical protein